MAAPAPMGQHDGAVRQIVNGVFKGGGAKGLLYGGALKAVAERKLWFRSVAGSSAGAITATLIAAGLSADEIVELAPSGLRGVRTMPLADLVSSPIFRTKGLQNWLEAILLRQVGRADVAPTPPENAVTFAQLFAASGIELFVVSVDVADRQPRVFSAYTTPDVTIAPAVIASSAIPMAFRPGRLEVRLTDGSVEVHRMMDGGVWANYPDFIFRDPSFAAFHGIKPAPPESVTIGFTLDRRPQAPAAEAVQFKATARGTTHDRGAFLPWIFRNPLLRLYFMTLIPVVVALQFWYTIDRGGLLFLKDYATRDWVPGFLVSSAGLVDGFVSHFFPATWAAIGFLLVAAVVAALIGGTLLDSGVPAIRTLMSVGTDVPYWVGAGDDDHVVRLLVPDGLKTTSFKLDPEKLNAVVQDGLAQAEPQLAAILTRSGVG